MVPSRVSSLLDTSPGSSSAGHKDQDLLGVVKTPGGECQIHKSPTLSDVSEVTNNNKLDLPNIVGLPADFIEEVQRVGGNSAELCARLLRAHSSEDLGFKAGQLCSTPEQLAFYKQELNAGPMVSRWLEYGYEIPFSSIPTNQLSAPNNKSCRDNLSFARAEVQNQVKMGVLSEVDWKPKIINPITCVYSTKWHLVIDCRLLNPYLVKRQTRLEDLSLISTMVEEGDYMSTDDLKSGYWQIKLNPNCRTYLGICLDGRFYVANVLILGISDAVFAFTKIVRPIARYLRARGVKCLVYIDDFWNAGKPASLSLKNRTFLLYVLAKCGWGVNISKHEEIYQAKIFLGLIIDSIKLEFRIPPEKLEDFLLLSQQVKSQALMPVRLLARYLGKLNSFSRALGQVVRLMTRNLYTCLGPAYTSGWGSLTSLTDPAREELVFWEANLV